MANREIEKFDQPGNPYDKVFGKQLSEELETYRKEVQGRGSPEDINIYDTPQGETIVRKNPLWALKKS